jgi:threonine dehydratase
MHGSVDDVVEVDDAALVATMRLIHRHVGVVVEPAGAAGVAAILAAPQTFHGRRVASVLCGGNLTQRQIHTFLSEPQGESS